jgi:hypothetical protein
VFVTSEKIDRNIKGASLIAKNGKKSSFYEENSLVGLTLG